MNISLSILPTEIVLHHVVLPNWSVSAIISFARTRREYYKETLEHIKTLWTRRVESSSSSQMTFSEFIGGCNQLFTDIESVNNLFEKNKELFSDKSKFSMMLLEYRYINDRCHSVSGWNDDVFAWLAYQQYEANYSVAYTEYLESDLKMVKSMEAEIAQKKFARIVDYFIGAFYLLSIIAVLVLAYYFSKPNPSMQSVPKIPTTSFLRDELCEKGSLCFTTKK